MKNKGLIVKKARGGMNGTTKKFGDLYLELLVQGTSYQFSPSSNHFHKDEFQKLNKNYEESDCTTSAIWICFSKTDNGAKYGIAVFALYFL